MIDLPCNKMTEEGRLLARLTVWVGGYSGTTLIRTWDFSRELPKTRTVKVRDIILIMIF